MSVQANKDHAEISALHNSGQHTYCDGSGCIGGYADGGEVPAKGDISNYLKDKYGKDMPHYDDGTPDVGAVGGFDVDTSDSSTVKTPAMPNGLSYINNPALPTENALQNEMSNPIPNTQGNGNPQGGPTPNQIAAMQAANAARSMGGARKSAPIAPVTPPSPVGDATQDAMNSGSKILGEFTPENKMALYQALLQKQGGMGNAIGSSLSTLGDALGAVAGGGRPTTNFSEKNTASNQQSRAEGNQLLNEGAQAKEQQFKLGSEAADKDPNSVSSKAAQQIASKITGKDMTGLTAATLNPILSTSASMADAKARIIEAYTQLKLDTALKQQQINVSKTGQTVQAAEDLNKTGLWQGLVNKFMEPGVDDTLEKVATGGNAGSGSSASGPYGPTTNYNGKTYVWSPISNQYHPAQ